MPQRTSLNRDWLFSVSDAPTAMNWDYNDSTFEAVQVPHDLNLHSHYDASAAAGSQGGYLQGARVGWYRRRLYLKKEQLQKRLWLCFDGILENSRVFFNETELGFRPYGFFPAVYEITGLVQEGANLIAVRADCEKQPSSRWYNGCGICRDVWLMEAAPSHIVWDSVFIRPESVSADCAVMHISADLVLKEPLSLQIRLLREQKIAAQSVLSLKQTDTSADLQLAIENPALWSPDTPELYQLQLELQKDGRPIDGRHLDFGVRKLEFLPREGMKLNGRPTKLKGVCLHHDAGVVGAAVTDGILRRRLTLLKEMGCNAIRTSHNPFSPNFYDLCDQMGFLVMDEIFDGWETPKAPYDYGIWFREHYQQDLETIVRRDRCHPCVALWSIGNEVVNGTPEMTAALQDMVHALDDTRPVTCGIQGTGKGSDACRAALDIAGYNDGGGACFIYGRDHEARPDQLMIATESPHTLQTRGFYRTRTWWRDKNQPRKEVENLSEQELFNDGCEAYHSSYDNAGVRLNVRDCWQITRDTPYLIGEFRWIGIDYYGESLHWPVRSAGSGLIDTAGIPKDQYYLYQALWTDPDTAPMAHILPHWTHSLTAGTEIPVFVYSNCDTVELFLNGVSLGIHDLSEEKWTLYQVPWQPGKLEAIACRMGRTASSNRVCTAMSPVGIRLEQIGPASYLPGEPCEIRASIADACGTDVPWADCPILFWAEGGQIIGTENGDSVDLTPLDSPLRRAFYGKCMALVHRLPCQSGQAVMAASILGRRYFDSQQTIRLASARLSLSPGGSAAPITFRYRLNDGPWLSYEDGISLTETSDVFVRILSGNILVGEMHALFIRGQAPIYEDKAHGNEEVQGDRPVGPFALQAAAAWRLNEDTVFRLLPDGRADLEMSGLCCQLGWWWYDFPVDWLEAQDYAGTGEIWFLSGEREPIHLTDQSASTLELDNSQMAFSTAYNKTPKLTFHRMEEVK